MVASNTTARAAKLLGRVVAAVFIAAVALSCAPLAPTSRPAPIIERAPASPPPVATAPAPPAAREPAVSVFPLAPPPDVESKPAMPPTTPEGPRAQRPPAPTSDLVALILPLEVPTYARAADAVRAGFLAAAEAAGEQAKVIVIGHKEDGVLAAFDQARARGVRVVIGPLLRDDLKTLVLADPEIPWTVALNQLDDRSPLPPTVFSFALTIDSDARVLAHLAQFEGVRAVELPWLVTPDAPQLASYPRRDFASAPLDRLYALGLDAFRIAQSFAPDPPQHLLFDGATGRIEQNDARTFVREGQLAVYRD